MTKAHMDSSRRRADVHVPVHLYEVKLPTKHGQEKLNYGILLSDTSILTYTYCLRKLNGSWHYENYTHPISSLGDTTYRPREAKPVVIIDSPVFLISGAGLKYLHCEVFYSNRMRKELARKSCLSILALVSEDSLTSSFCVGGWNLKGYYIGELIKVRDIYKVLMAAKLLSKRIDPKDYDCTFYFKVFWEGNYESYEFDSNSLLIDQIFFALTNYLGNTLRPE